MSDQDETIGYAMEFKPTIWHRLGFGHAYVPPWDDPEKDGDDHYVITEVVVVFDWKDRLRLMLTGCLSVEVRVKTQHDAGNTEGRSAVKVMSWRWQPR